MIFLSKYIVIIYYVVVVCACSALGFHKDSTVLPDYIRQTGFLENKDIEEASGISASRLRKDLLWIVNDGGNPAVLYAVSLNGANIGAVFVENVPNVDWEDLTAFVFQNKSYLLIADVGDNKAKRDTCSLFFIEEPDISDTSPPIAIAVAPAREITFRYEDGPRDCESVAVDTANQRILLLSKRTKPPELYELPLLPDNKSRPVLTARKLAAIRTIKPVKNTKTEPGSLWGQYQNKPTAMDISSDGSLLAVLTYEQILLYHRNPQEDWVSAISRSPKSILLPRLEQAESICFGADGKSLFITSEQLPAPLLRLSLRDLDTQ